jgi:(E)-4-hydroxy-3-methylbut-2-enyl-diphosphate synthase
MILPVGLVVSEISIDIMFYYNITFLKAKFLLLYLITRFIIISMRRKTKAVLVGKVKIGGLALVSVQSMTKTDTRDIKATVRQIRELEKLGCEIIRIAVPDYQSALSLPRIKKSIRIPIEVDIHFNPKLALESIKQGIDAVRLNPGNMTDKEPLIEIVKSAKRARIPIRVGINSGSVRGWYRSALRHEIVRRSGPAYGISPANKIPSKQSQILSRAALEYIRFLEFLNFHNIMVSLKSSDVISTIEAYRELSTRCDYPFHLGITASGTIIDATVKSSIGIGVLLLEGIGDTIRVSITGPPEDEVRIGYKILESLGLRKQGLEIISCPTCARCKIDIVRITEKVKSRIERIPELSASGGSAFGRKDKNIKVAIMGCVVNGPGEAEDCDVGIAGGQNFGFLFKHGIRIRKVPESKIVSELIKEIKAI